MKFQSFWSFVRWTYYEDTQLPIQRIQLCRAAVLQGRLTTAGCPVPWLSSWELRDVTSLLSELDLALRIVSFWSSFWRRSSSFFVPLNAFKKRGIQPGIQVSQTLYQQPGESRSFETVGPTLACKLSAHGIRGRGWFLVYSTTWLPAVARSLAEKVLFTGEVCPLKTVPNKHNVTYLLTKRDRLNHKTILSELPI